MQTSMDTILKIYEHKLAKCENWEADSIFGEMIETLKNNGYLKDCVDRGMPTPPGK